MILALVGQPNSGKSTFFNAIVGYRSLTSNFPGSTAECVVGAARVDGQLVEIVDLPPVASLLPVSAAERSTVEFLLERPPNVVIQVVDASQLERSLELTLELLELGLPLVVSLNKMDEAVRKGIRIDRARLEEELGVPVVEAAAVHGRGVAETFRLAVRCGARAEHGSSQPRSHLPPATKVLPRYPQLIEQALGSLMAESQVEEKVPRRFRAVKLLEGDPRKWAGSENGGARVARLKEEMEQALGSPPDVLISSARAAAARQLFERVAQTSQPRFDIRESLDHMLMHPLWGYVLLALILFAFFHLIFGLGKPLEQAVLNLFSRLLAAAELRLGAGTLTFAALKGMLLGTAGAVALVLPYLTPFLVGLAFLEEVGYLPRVAYLMDSLMHRVGLQGTATLPVLLGYGCSVPAVLATRLLRTRRERLIAAVISTLIPCSARMTVILGLVGFYLGANWALAIYVLNLAVVVVSGKILSHLLPQMSFGMLMEVPPYRTPSLGLLLRKSWWRMREFVVVAVPLLVLGSVVLSLAEFWRWQEAINTVLRPLTALLGLPAAVGATLIFGLLRKELSMLMLIQALGTPDVASLMSTSQIVVFTLFVTFYIPCLATIAALNREVGRRLMLATAFTTLVLAVAVGTSARLLFWLFG